MFFFSGLGFLVPVVTLASMMAVQWTAGYIAGDSGYYTANDWPKNVAVLFAALMNYGLHRLLLRISPSSEMNPETGEVIVHQFRHTFFFIPVRWWPLTIIFLAILCLVDPLG